MFDIGFGELVIIGLIGLLVLGPERLPGVAKTLGGFVRKARRTWHQMRVELESEVDRSRIRDIKNEMTETRKQLRESVQAADDSLRQTGDKLQQTVNEVSQPTTGSKASPRAGTAATSNNGSSPDKPSDQ